MNKINVLILILLFQSCSFASIRVSAKKSGVDPEFNDYVKSYKLIIEYKNKSTNIESYRNRINRLSMNFSNLKAPVIGRCFWLLNGEYEIEIDKQWWENAGFLSKEFLAYHELEHCIRHRMHTHPREDGDFLSFLQELFQKLGIIKKRGFFEDGCPDSIMYPHVNGEYCYYLHYDSYIKEMYLYDK